ncbi:riboflavin synthase [Aristolochia californica]|uniref:riboflavin synthase n=1 Tax=Aristolochia californica TaxID=171875 RepID=UPI0035DB1D9C
MMTAASSVFFCKSLVKAHCIQNPGLFVPLNHNLKQNYSVSHLAFKSHSLHILSRSKSRIIKPSAPFRSPIKCLFTGIVEEMGEVVELGSTSDGGFNLKIHAKTILSDVKLGDSIAVNGTCLTVTHFDLATSNFTVGLAPETLRKTSLIELSQGSLVNLERALLPSTRMGGHFVQGHVDGTGEIASLVLEKDSVWVKVRTSQELLKFIVPKGFIAVDGTSLTVVNVYDEELCFDFMLVAYTQQKVVIPLKKVGQKVNLEVDILGKYVERLLSSGGFTHLPSSS